MEQKSTEFPCTTLSLPNQTSPTIETKHHSSTFITIDEQTYTDTS